MAARVIQNFKDTTQDLIWSIIKRIDPTMTPADIRQLYRSTTDDLLFALLEKMDGFAGPGNGNASVGTFKYVELEFDGTPGKGAVGPYTLPAGDPDVEAGTVITQLYFKVTDALESDPGTAIIFGIATDAEDCALDDKTGNVETLNANGFTRILTPKMDQVTTADRNFIMQITGAPITAGKATIVLHTLKF